MQCPTCGSRVSDGADVCPDCGMDLQNLSAPAPSASAPNASAPISAPAAEFAPADSTSDDSAFDAFEFDGTPEASASENGAPENSATPAPISLDKTDTNSASSPSSQQATLTLKRGGTLTQEKFVIGTLASVGRFDPESGPVDVDMANLPEASYVSRHHAEIRCAENGWSIKDLGSRNGTFVRAASGGAFARVNGEHALHDGDEVSLGNARFEFRTAN